MDENRFVTGSNYFFKNMESFEPHDLDYIVLEEYSPYPDKILFCGLSRTPDKKYTIDYFHWVRTTPEKYIEFVNNYKRADSICAFLIPEFVKEIGFTIEDLKKMKPTRERLNKWREYLGMIYDFYIINNDFVLNEEQRQEVYSEYKKQHLKK